MLLWSSWGFKVAQTEAHQLLITRDVRDDVVLPPVSEPWEYIKGCFGFIVLHVLFVLCHSRWSADVVSLLFVFAKFTTWSTSMSSIQLTWISSISLAIPVVDMNWQMVKFFIRSLKFIWRLKVRFLISSQMNILHGTRWVHGWVARWWRLRLRHHRAVVAVVGVVRLNELKELDVRLFTLWFSILILSFHLNYLEVLVLDESMAFLKASW